MDQEKVRDLRARTGAGIVDCTNALAEADDVVDTAVDILRKKEGILCHTYEVDELRLRTIIK